LKEEGRLESIEVVNTDLQEICLLSFENAYQLRETKLAAVNNANSVDGEPDRPAV
jgi:hypothetical protein